jgi:hypothetical protein
MKRLHYIVGLLGVLAFVLSGQAMRFHKPAMKSLEAGAHMMYVSRHIYILGGALVNVMLGLYLRMESRGWRRNLQLVGSVMLLLSPILLTLAFLQEPEIGMAGRSAVGVRIVYAAWRHGGAFCGEAGLEGELTH